MPFLATGLFRPLEILRDIAHERCSDHQRNFRRFSGVLSNKATTSIFAYRSGNRLLVLEGGSISCRAVHVVTFPSGASGHELVRSSHQSCWAERAWIVNSVRCRSRGSMELAMQTSLQWRTRLSAPAEVGRGGEAQDGEEGLSIPGRGTFSRLSRGVEGGAPCLGELAILLGHLVVKLRPR